eukprot:470641-Amphidinium_carterae.1
MCIRDSVTCDESCEVMPGLVLDSDVDPSAAQAALDGFADMQKVWLGSRSSTEKGQQKPDVPRKKAFAVLASVSHMCELFIGDDMVTKFRPLPPVHPSRWPSLSLALDQGSDGMSAFHYMANKLGLNVSLFCDPSHQWQRDIIGAWTSCHWQKW